MGENNKPHFIQQDINTQGNVIISCFMNKLVIIYIVLK